MNPLDLPGPQFLGFYVILCTAVTLALAFLRRQQEGGGSPPPKLDDPYLVAFLRGGEDEALRVAMMSLLDRGLLKVQESNLADRFAGAVTGQETFLLMKAGEGAGLAARPIEKQVLQAFQAPAGVRSVLRDLKILGVCDAYAASLTQMNLLPDEETKGARRRLAFVAVGILLAVALAKIVVALGRGRSNIQFLVILAAVFAFVAFKAANPFRTVQGDRFLADLKTLFDSLRGRAASLRPGGGTSELAWLAAVFGLSAVPATVFPYTRKLQQSAVSAGNGSSCGSGCGGGCGSGCGGGCGGCGS